MNKHVQPTLSMHITRHVHACALLCEDRLIALVSNTCHLCAKCVASGGDSARARVISRSRCSITDCHTEQQHCQHLDMAEDLWKSIAA